MDLLEDEPGFILNLWTCWKMTVDFKIHPEFCRHDKDKGVVTDFDKVMTDLDKGQTPSPSLNPKMILTKFFSNLV